MSVVCVGRFGRIGSLLRELRRSGLHVHFRDVRLICSDGSITAHKFIIAAHSRYLRSLLKSSGSVESEPVSLVIPDVRLEHLKIVVLFLYSGKLIISKSQVPFVREILEKVLCIDAKMSFPGGNPIPFSKDHDNTPPRGGGTPPGSGARRAFKRDSDNAGGGAGGSDSHRRRITQQMSANSTSKDTKEVFTLSPPHSLTEGDEEERLRDISEVEDSLLAAYPGLSVSTASIEECRSYKMKEEVVHVSDPRTVEQESLEVAKHCQLKVERDPDLIEIEANDDKKGQSKKVAVICLRTNESRDQHVSSSSSSSGQPSSKKRHISNANRDSDESEDEDDLSYKCSLCSRRFARVADLRDHTKSAHDSDDESASLDRFRDVPTAPGAISKSTSGGGMKLHLARKSTSRGGARQCLKRPWEEHELGEGTSSQPLTRSTTGALQRPITYNENDGLLISETDFSLLEEPIPGETEVAVEAETVQDDDEIHIVVEGDDDAAGVWEQQTAESDHQMEIGVPEELLMPLLPPISERLGEDEVVHRGSIISVDKFNRLMRNRDRSNAKAVGKVRGYNYKPFVTISGYSKAGTVLEHEHGQDGEFQCPECPNRYSRQRSLEVHMKRIHQEGVAECNICHKRLSHPGALKKHYLTHVPESEWPFRCPLCGKMFQAKGDLPKHLKTRLHEKDNIPAVGTPEWVELIERSVVVPSMSSRKRMPGSMPVQKDMVRPGEQLAVVVDPDGATVNVTPAFPGMLPPPSDDPAAAQLDQEPVVL